MWIPDETSLYILYKVNPAEGTRKYLRHVLDHNSTEVAGLELGQTYKFQLVRVDGSTQTDSNIITIFMGTIPSPPTDLHASEETLTDVTISWSAPAFTGFVDPELLTY